MGTTETGPAIEAFNDRFGPAALVPGDPGYEEERKVWNGSIDKRPAVIVRCRTTEDAVAAVNLSRESGALIAVRGGGHSLPGLGTCDGGVVIDLSPMRGVVVDADARTAQVGPGATWRDLDAATAEHGLATTGGLISTTGVAGLTLGGGIGWLMRKHGLSCDNLVAAEVVTAAGEIVRTNSSVEPELLWGLRGGGGNFGIVTRFEFRLHPVSTVLGGLMMFPLERGSEVLRVYRAWADELGDEFSTLVGISTAPPAPFVPADLVGRKIVAVMGCWCSEPAAGEAALGPIRQLNPAVDLFGPMPYSVLQTLGDEGAPAGARNYFRSGYTDGLSEGLIDEVLEHGGRMPSPMSQIHLHQMGGAVARVGENDTAFSTRRAAYAYNLVSTWTDAGDDDANIGANRDLAAALAPFSTGGVYVNFLGDEGDARIRAAYGDSKYERLQRLKRDFDPDNLFRVNQNIPPAP
jgi:FAD binding domain/Berberine and berberine like